MITKRSVTIEFDRVKITTALDHKNRFWCELCRAQTEFMTAAEAVELIKVMHFQGLSVKREELHLFEPDGSRMLVCLHSIVNSASSTKIY